MAKRDRGRVRERQGRVRIARGRRRSGGRRRLGRARAPWRRENVSRETSVRAFRQATRRRSVQGSAVSGGRRGSPCVSGCCPLRCRVAGARRHQCRPCSERMFHVKHRFGYFGRERMFHVKHPARVGREGASSRSASATRGMGQTNVSRETFCEEPRVVRAPGRRCSPGLQPPCAGASFGGSGVVRLPAHGPRASAATAVCGRAACLTARSLGFLCRLRGVPVLAVEARETDVAHAAHEIVGDPLGHVVRHEAALLRDAA